MRMIVFVAALLCAAPAVAAPDAAPSDAAPVVTVVDAARAPAPVAGPKTTDEVPAAVASVVKDFKANHIRAGIGGIIMLLVFAWRKWLSGLLLKKLPDKALPIVVAGVAFLAAIPTALSVDPWSWKTFLWQGVVTGAEAIAFWSVLGKFLLKRFLPDKK